MTPLEKTTSARILFVEDDESLRVTQSLYLKEEGFKVLAVPDRALARSGLMAESFDVVITDLRIGADSGLDVLRDTRAAQPAAEVIVITGYGSVDSAVEAMKEGAYDYMTKPVDPEDLVRVIRKALERRQLRRQVSNLQERVARESGLNRVIAESSAMRKILEQIDNVAQSDASVLIEGESGTGKELLAKLIHERSRRAAGPFLGINCGAMPESLLETELFGHVKGAFTGAQKDKTGLFEAADGGTLFLDEIGDIPPSFQVKLLRTLQEQKIRRVGDTRERAVHVRIIAASNKDLAELVVQGRFRRDLYFRIKVVPVVLPPLRQRPEDILPLADSFLARLSDRMGRPKPILTAAAKRRLMEYQWPGNVRELENTLERTLIFNKDNSVGAESLIIDACFPAEGRPAGGSEDWRTSLAEVERVHILKVLKECGNNKKQASEILEIGYNTLWRKLKKYEKHGRGETRS